MPPIRLARLAERTPVKLSIAIAPGLHDELAEYAAFYEQSYGRAERVETLIPAIVAAFLEADRGFIQQRKRSKK
jgi:hypothetical protein